MDRESYHHGDLKRALLAAGTEHLARTGAAGFSLRKVAELAGVSHAAPYAHFRDKQALIAAIVTEGYRLLFERMDEAVRARQGEPRAMLLAAAWAYMEFAAAEPESFSVIFSGALEREKEHPEYVEATARCYDLLLEVVRACQEAGELAAEPEDIAATRLWSCLHGFASLYAKGLLSHRVLDRSGLRELVAELVAPRRP